MEAEVTTPWPMLTTAILSLDNTPVGLGFKSHVALKGDLMHYEADVNLTKGDIWNLALKVGLLREVALLFFSGNTVCKGDTR